MTNALGTPSNDSSATADASVADFPVRVEGLCKSFGRLRVLKDITLSFPRGKTTVVLGPSGCGKSVLLKHLIGLLHPEKGKVFFEHERIDTLTERTLAPIRRQFGFLFQQGALFDSMNVYENVAFPLRELEGKSPYDEEARVRRVLRLVGLESSMFQQPSELSGGQQKRVALARAVVLADPPSIDKGEITDKGSINQRAVLKERAVAVKEDRNAGKSIKPLTASASPVAMA